MALGDADLRVFFRCGDPVAFEGVSTYSNGQPVMAIVEDLGKDGEFDQVKVSDVRYSMELPFDAFTPFPRSGSHIQVLAGRLTGEYVVRSADPLDDGATIELRLRLA